MRETLADLIVRRGVILSGADEKLPERGIACANAIISGLQPNNDHAVVEHALSIKNIGRRLNTQRFVFCDNPPMVVQELSNTQNLTPGQIYTTCQMPDDDLWIEFYSDEGVRVGYYAHTRPSGKVMVFHCVEAANSDVLALGCFITDVPVKLLDGRYMQTEISWLATSFVGPDVSRRTTVEQMIVNDFITCLFLLSVPRLTDLVSSYGKRIVVKGKDYRELPAIEHKVVKLHLGTNAKRYETARRDGESEQDYHRRLHRVIGHFRTYVKGREQPRMSWVPPHWRGDASKGVVLRTTEVSK